MTLRRVQKVWASLSAGAVAALSLSALIHAASFSGAGGASVVDAAMRGNRDAVRALLKDGADVNTSQADGMTALHWAAQKHDVELARMLLYAGANIKATTRIGGYTPLLLAAKNGDAPMIEALVAGGADANGTTVNGTTPLMFAAAAGNADAVKVLLSHGADVNANESAKGETALMFAVAYGRTDAVKLLAAAGADLKVTTKTVDGAVFAREEAERFAQFQQQGGAAAGGRGGRGGAAPAAQAGAGRGGRGAGIAGVDRQYLYTELVGMWGGLAPVHIAARQGQFEAMQALLDAGADINQVTAGDKVTPILVATINGQFDLARYLLDHGADPNIPAGNNGATPLYAAVNCEWAPKSAHPQPRAYGQQHATYLDLMKALLDKGADPNARLTKKIWYSGYNFDLSGVDETGATPFWRAAYASDVDAMKLLVAYGADPNIWSKRTPGRVRTGDQQRDVQDVSGLPPVPVGAPAISPLLATSGQGYGEGFASNSHRYAPAGMLAAVKYLVEELHADVNSRDHEGNTALHHAAARGDVEMIRYLVSKGADVTVVSREGKTVADMANGPAQRIQPWPEALALLEKLGSKNNHKCVSC